MEDTNRFRKPARLALAATILAAGAAIGALIVPGGQAPVARHLDLVARQFYYTPNRIAVNRGDTLYLSIASGDVVHGFFLEGHDIDAMVIPGETAFRTRSQENDEKFEKVDEVVFTADKPGKFRFRCSVTCGTLHPFMQGELIVRPNRTYGAGIGAASGLFFAAFFLMLSATGRKSHSPPWRLDLLAVVPGLGWLVNRRWFSFAILFPCLVILFIFLLAGFWGSPIGNRNIIVTIVWIFWWFILITIFVPFGGRVWCMMCPLPSVGEWMVRGKLIGAGKNNPGTGLFKPKGLNRRWPSRFSNIWIQNILFLVVCSISTILVTRPALTAFVLLGLLVVATGVQWVYRKRTFCSYLCPLNSWMSIYAMTAMTEIRPKDPAMGAACRGKACAVDKDDTWGCPWFLNPGKLDRNNYCGLCMECIKSCPNDNMTLNARPFCSDTKIRSMDEGWMAFIMVVLALAYTIAFLGPWGEVKLWTDVTEFGQWGRFFQYTAMIWIVALAVMPGLWLGCSWLGGRISGKGGPGLREMFLRYSYMMVPLGLMAWMAFSYPLIMVNATHISTSLSDPMGWGWDLFGTAHSRWKPLWPEYLIYIQIPLLLVGLSYALLRGYGIASEFFDTPRAAAFSLLPHGMLCTGIVIGFIRLFAG